MTKEFEDWVHAQVVTREWDYVHPINCCAADFWISRIFAEIEREAAALANANSHGREALPNFVDYRDALAQIKTKFDLGDGGE